jgi:hypothetical protein
MITLKLELDDLLLLADLVQRSKGDFEAHLWHDPEEVQVEGYASVVLLQVHNRLELLEKTLSSAAPEPLEFCTASQSLRLRSQCRWRAQKASEGVNSER